MLFTSTEFVALYLCTLGLFLITAGTLRRRILLAASYVFYAGDSIAYLAILLMVTGASYAAGQELSDRTSPRRLALWVALIASPLALFKAVEFAAVDIPLLAAREATGARASVIPIGISFYTLQALSYVVDVHRRTGPRAPDLETHALYLAFFPQLLAGPIERASRLIPQLRQLPTPSGTDVYVGVKTMIWGYFCKLVVGDNVGGIVDRVLLSADRVPAASLPVSLYLYSFQLYFDFLGYTMIAIGLGRTLGVRLSPNFDRPYLSASLRDFWRRWHITLSTWLRDYLYRPLRGDRPGYGRFALAILVTFLVSGLWHGAAVNYVLWGGLHGILFLAADGLGRLGPVTRSTRWRLPATVLKVLVCFSVVSFAWLFFRVERLESIALILSRMWTWIAAGVPVTLAPFFYRTDSMVVLSLLAAGFLMDSLQVVERVLDKTPCSPAEIGRELVFMNVVVIALVLFGDLGQREFIYFRF